ncbi:YeeE/YedE family protein [Saccharopolyspora rhizosphaerae]|uniref:YeeE/YedE family protein n=1 Tax=Saccharopolyspora rhizosphaerae TaxID=2492662 RepID=A0A426JSF5_9PSEU|nr:YeeE/YedE family protein [Saccharopolyspora rhizosphaerae]RRO16125.1 YeeE/YedE family protein [Saccharopolyspora rhizosphaerae]
MSVVEAGRPAPPLVREAPPAQRGVVAIGIAIAAVLGVAVHSVAGWKMTVLYAVGLALGLVLFHSRFGFTSAWRQLITVGQGRAIRAHMLMLGVAALLFAGILGTGFSLSGEPQPQLQTAGLGVVFGAFLFGVGMQVGGSCASGTLFAVGSGQTAIVLTLGGFIVGSVFSAFISPFIKSVQSIGPKVSLADTPLGYAGGVLFTLLIIGAVVGISVLVERRRTPPPIGQPPVAKGIVRALRGSWPLWVGAVLLAVLNAVTLFVSGNSWGITSAFGLWGAKILGAVGIDISSAPFWQDPDNAAKLASSVLTDRISVMDFGIMIGALIAAALAGAFTLHRKVPWKMAVGAVLGGILMGVGARFAGGCNIGAYFSGIASFSLHGWLWGVMAIIGTYAGVALRPLFGLGNPKPSDAVC